MDATTMRNAGYRISLQCTDAEVDKAFNDAMDAYIRPILDNDRPGTSEVAAAMQLAYILLLKRHAVATRSGGKTKLTPTQSENAYPTQEDFDTADRLLRFVQTLDGARQGLPSKLVDDIAGIYYRNTFIGL